MSIDIFPRFYQGGRFWAAVVVLLISTAGCGRFGGNERSFVAPTVTNPGDPIQAKAGAEFSIVIASNHSTAYRWKLRSPKDETIIQLTGMDYETTPGLAVGAGGWDTWRFKARAPGEIEITLALVPYSESADSEALRFSKYKVIVH